MLLLDDGEQPIVASYMEHQSLAYGADWAQTAIQEIPNTAQAQLTDHISHSQTDTPLQESFEGLALKSDMQMHDTISSCSFYDHAMHMWNWHRGGPT